MVVAEAPHDHDEEGDANRQAGQHLSGSAFFRGWNEQTGNRRHTRHTYREPEQEGRQTLGLSAEEKTGIAPSPVASAVAEAASSKTTTSGISECSLSSRRRLIVQHH